MRPAERRCRAGSAAEDRRVAALAAVVATAGIRGGHRGDHPAAAIGDVVTDSKINCICSKHT